MNTEELLYGEGTCGSNCAYAFNRSTGELTIRVEGAMPDYDGANVGWMNFKTSVTSINIVDACTYVGANSFLSFSKLTSVTLPSTVKKIGDGAFRYCTELSAFTLPENLQEIGNNVFQGCTNLRTFTFPETLTKIGNNAFEGIANAERVGSDFTMVIPSSVTSIGDYAFTSIGRLGTLKLNCKLSALTGTNIFTKCDDLNYVNIPNYELNNDTTSLSILMEKGIKAGASFTAGNLAGVLSSPLNISNMTYKGESVIGTVSGTQPSVSNLPIALNINPASVAEVRIPLDATKVGKNAFYGCTSLKTIQNLESITQIKDNAFYNCTGLNNLTIPKTVTSIGSGAFNNVPHIYYSGSATGSPWGAKAIN